MARSKEPLDRETLDPTRSYPVDQVAHLVGWTPRWLRYQIREGRVQASRPGGHQWRIPGTEVQRMLNNLEREGTVGPRPDFIGAGQVQDIQVTEEQARRLGLTAPDASGDPPANPAPSGESPKKGFWDAVDEELKQGNPLLFGGGS